MTTLDRDEVTEAAVKAVVKSKRQSSSPAAPQSQGRGGKARFKPECLEEAIKLGVFIP